MASPIEDYALLGDTHTAALVGRDGSIDWLCLPRFDSAACFAALVGDEDNGRWRLAPHDHVRSVRRRYRGDTLVLETDFETAEGSIRVVDFMPRRNDAPHVVRLVEGMRGRVRVHTDVTLRFDYGRIRPLLRPLDGAYAAVAGPDSVWLRSPVKIRAEDFALRADFFVSAGELFAFDLSWRPSHELAPRPIDPLRVLAETEVYWADWVSSCTYEGEWREAVVRSLLTLKALTYAPTGGIVAAPTTSLPEQLGGVRNWDYRYCWLRDAAVTLLALTRAGLREEAAAWHSWLLRAIAGEPSELQAVYGIAGERRLTELELPWLSGFEGSTPVRIGNDAAEQFQLDLYGEVVNTLHEARRAGLEDNGEVWSLMRALVDFVESHWHLPDEGLWEVRGPRRHFVNSKVMAWVAIDRALVDAEELGLPAPLDRWRRLREEIRREVLLEGYDANRKTFTQSYGSSELDASALLFPLVGFLPAIDERMRGTVAAIERHLTQDGLAHRYTTSDGTDSVDGLPEGEGAFLACSFWLAANYAKSGRLDDAHALFERLLSLRNDVGLLAEEYDPVAGQQLGNVPQAFSHVPLVMAAHVLDEALEQAAASAARSVPTLPSHQRTRSNDHDRGN
jgi:GH15 family glucan-1,4-alpha-glucosidase